ncbi:MAG TPA: PIG-L deacetylase family protein [Magnetospirillum sp.]|nr:PIG-L deacetylase family protein [Magnetospirillum sp.]
MRPMSLARRGENLSVLCLGAHADDIEIGAGGTILGWIAAGVRLDVQWCVCSATGARADEACRSAAAFLDGARHASIELGDFADSLFPTQTGAIKAWLARIRDGFCPDVILTHRRDDAHQDHREISELTANIFRDHLILEYEIPKWDGDLGRPNLYMPLSDAVLDRKIGLLLDHFGSQRSKDWFEPETFRSMARLRGIECRAPDRHAEAFVLRKAVML